MARSRALGLAVLAACAAPRPPSVQVIPVDCVGAAASDAPLPSPPPACRPGMVLFAGGPFVLGPMTKSGGFNDGSSLETTVAPFCLDRTEVTVAAYRACVDRKECFRPELTTRSDDPPADQKWSALCNGMRPDRDQHPVNCVTFVHASSYCASLGVRLPTEAEWEFAAAGGAEKRVYPWGNDPPRATLLNACDQTCLTMLTAFGPRWTSHQGSFQWSDGFEATAPVGSFPEGNSKEGISDLAGNVNEWTSSEPCTYEGKFCARRSKIARGSSFMDHLPLLLVTTRRGPSESMASPNLGFRCAAAPAAGR